MFIMCLKFFENKLIFNALNNNFSLGNYVTVNINENNKIVGIVQKIKKIKFLIIFWNRKFEKK